MCVNKCAPHKCVSFPNRTDRIFAQRRNKMATVARWANKKKSHIHTRTRVRDSSSRPSIAISEIVPSTRTRTRTHSPRSELGKKNHYAAQPLPPICGVLPAHREPGPVPPLVACAQKKSGRPQRTRALSTPENVCGAPLAERTLVKPHRDARARALVHSHVSARTHIVHMCSAMLLAPAFLCTRNFHLYTRVASCAVACANIIVLILESSTHPIHARAQKNMWRDVCGGGVAW